MSAHQEIVGIILAGGASRRMARDAHEQADKTLADLGGRPMLSHIIERLRPQVRHLILNANGDPLRFATFDLEVIADDANNATHPSQTGRGPLAGLSAALTWAEARDPRPAWIASVASDVPFLPHDLVARLSAAGDGKRIVIATSRGRRHPPIGLWPVRRAPDLRAALTAGRLSLDRLAQEYGTIEVAFPMGQIGSRVVDPFFNTNTPEDLDEARRLIAGSR